MSSKELSIVNDMRANLLRIVHICVSCTGSLYARMSDPVSTFLRCSIAKSQTFRWAMIAEVARSRRNREESNIRYDA